MLVYIHIVLAQVEVWLFRSYFTAGRRWQPLTKLETARPVTLPSTLTVCLFLPHLPVCLSLLSLSLHPISHSVSRLSLCLLSVSLPLVCLSASCWSLLRPAVPAVCAGPVVRATASPPGCTGSSPSRIQRARL